MSNDEIKKILFSQRKKNICAFYYLIKNHIVKGKKSIDSYREKHNILKVGDEAIWHHFLKENSWIIGLNVKLQFIRDFLDEQKVGMEDSKGKDNPIVDLLGLSYFMTLIELKTSETKIFKSNKSNKSRSNTWDFSEDFIEAYSQALAQKTDFNQFKEFRDEDIYIDKNINRILDPKAILIIGNRNVEFPHGNVIEKITKSECFERFRSSNKNVDIITFDELFERAFHIVYFEKLPENWYSIENELFIKDCLKW